MKGRSVAQKEKGQEGNEQETRQPFKGEECRVAGKLGALALGKKINPRLQAGRQAGPLGQGQTVFQSQQGIRGDSGQPLHGLRQLVLKLGQGVQHRRENGQGGNTTDDRS